MQSCCRSFNKKDEAIHPAITHSTTLPKLAKAFGEGLPIYCTKPHAFQMEINDIPDKVKNHILNPVSTFPPKVLSNLNPNACSFVPATKHSNFQNKDMAPTHGLFPTENLQLDTQDKVFSICGFTALQEHNIETQLMPKSPITLGSNSPCVNDFSDFSDLSGLDNTSHSVNCVQNLCTPVLSEHGTTVMKRRDEDSNNTSYDSPNADIADFVSDNLVDNEGETDDKHITILNEIRKKFVNNVVMGS